MGHHISAVVLCGDFNQAKAREFDLTPIELGSRLTLFPLDAGFCDHWSDSVDVDGFVSERPILNCRVVHHMMCSIADKPLFAVIETDYFGGVGDPSAAVYRGESEVMARTSAEVGPINEALSRIGVHRKLPNDEFDSVGLGQYRDFDNLFDKYNP